MAEPVRVMNEGDVAEWTVVSHHPWGVEVALVGDESTRGSIDDVPCLRDLAPNERIHGEQDCPPVGDEIRAVVRVRWPDSDLHLSARRSDVEQLRPTESDQ